MRTCQTCHVAQRNEATWAWQPFGPDDASHGAFSRLGSHYRGFPVVRVCDACKRKIERGISMEFTYRKVRYAMTYRGPLPREKCAEEGCQEPATWYQCACGVPRCKAHQEAHTAANFAAAERAMATCVEYDC